MRDPATVVDEITALYARHGGADYIGEAVSQLTHAAQAADQAEAAGHDAEVIAAAFLHDVGHLCALGDPGDERRMGGYGRHAHDRIGADYLRALGFPERVARLVESHVDAKRYLTFTDAGYYERLSEASKTTLGYQGGPMDAVEAAAFEARDDFDLVCALRRWDEAAKEPAEPVRVDAYRDVLRAALDS